MNTPARAIRRLALAHLLFLGLVACGGGGGGGGSNTSISGTIAMPSGAPIFETEPNDNIGQSQSLGSIAVGETIQVIGQVAAAPDDLDAFVVVAPSRVKITATLTFDGANDFDLGIFDAIANDFVEVSAGLSQPEVITFHAQGTFFPVVQQFSGSGTYTLTLASVAPADPIAEREPNDLHGEAQYLGTIEDGEVVRLSGNAHSITDPDDRFLLAVPADIDLAASLAHPGGLNDFDVIYADATLDLLSPTLIAAFTSPVANPETGTASITALTIVEVTVNAAVGSGAYVLTLTATAADDSARGARSWRSPATTRVLRRPFTRELDASFSSPLHESMPGELLVLARDGFDVSSELTRRGLTVEARIPGGAMKCVEPVPPGVSQDLSRRHTLALVASLGGVEGVEYAEPNFICRPYGITPNDPFFGRQWHYDQIQLPAAWNITQGDNAIRMGVIDTGETLHPDLASRLIQGFDFISNASVAGDGGGVDTNPTDVGDGQGAQPSSFHGTHVAGTMGAATDNGVGVAGVTWFGQIMHLRVLGIGGGSVFDISNAVRHSAGLSSTAQPLIAPLATPLDVINMSLGGPGFSQTFQNACTAAHNAGVVVFAAAGNENSTIPSFPAAFDDVISVAAVDFNAARAPYSNRHPTVDLAAPGGDMTKDLNGDGFPDGVFSTIADDSGNPTVFTFTFFQGTSMATPHAAGVAALILAADPLLTPAQVESVLTSTATDLGAPGHDNSFGHGLVNAFQAVLQASQGTPVNPVLGLSAQNLSFGTGTSALNVQVTNLGGGTLHVSTPIVSTDSGGNWLAASRVVIAVPVSSDTSAIAISVDRTGLPDGVFTGSVTVPSDGTNGSLVIQVALQVDSTPTQVDVDIFVLAIDSATGDPFAQDVVNPNGTLDYALGALPAGSYFIVAGSDDNDDGFIIGPGDRFAGAFPTLDQPVELTIAAGEALPAVDFAVQEGFEGSSTPAQGRKFRLLRP